MAKEFAVPAELNGVTRRFGSVLALDDLSLAIRPGELVALLGANGAGKTTAVRLLLGLARPDSGSARIFGGDPRDPRTRLRVGAMLQIAKVPETMRVSEHIELFSSYYGDPLPLPQIVEMAGLRGLERRLYGELSGGQKQRVLFAIALCGDPDLLILDEPTVGLDVDARRGIWEQIRDLVDRGRSVLLTTHYLHEADALADRIVVIDRGRVIAEGTPREIKGTVATRKIRCATVVSIDVIRTLPTVTSVHRDGAMTDVLAADTEAVVRQLLALDPTLAELEISRAGLEEAFLSLTQPAREVA